MPVDKGTLKELGFLREKIIEEQKKATTTGKVCISKKNFLYIRLENGKKVSLNESEARKVLPGDIVAVSVNKNKNKYVGVVTKIISTNKDIIIGEVYKRGKEFYIRSYDKITAPIYVKASFKKLYVGEVVEAEIKENSHPFEKGRVAVNVTYSIGNKNSQDIKIKLAKYKHGVVTDVICNPNDFSSKNSKRVDLTDLDFFSIDSEKTIDIDDAIAIEKNAIGYNLYIAISDVSDVVSENSSIEKAAIVKTSSIYYPNQVTHMLPENLGSSFLSLNSGNVKKAFVLSVNISNDGEVKNYDFCEANIFSKAKLSYSEVNHYFKKGVYSKRINDSKLKDSIDDMFDLYYILKNKREEESIIRLYSKFYINQVDSGQLLDIIPYDRNIVKSIIEEYMILANKLAADFMASKGSGLFKIKNEFEKLNPFLLKFNKDFPKERVSKISSLGKNIEMYQKMLKSSNDEYVDKIHENSIKTSIVSNKMAPHYSLGFRHYTSFTSPMRRYSDIIVHRYIKYHMGISGYENPDSYFDKEMVQYLNEKEESIENSRKMVMHMFYCDFFNKNKDMLNSIFTASIEKITDKYVLIKLIDYGISGYLHIDKVNFSYEDQKIKIANHTYNLCDIIQVKLNYFNKKGFSFKPY